MQITQSQLATLGMIQNRLNTVAEPIGVKFRLFFAVYSSEAGRVMVTESIEGGAESITSVSYFLGESGIDLALKSAQTWAESRVAVMDEIFTSIVEMRALYREGKNE